MYQHKSSSTVASSAASTETPRFTLEIAAVLSLLVQRQRGAGPAVGGAEPRLSPGVPAEIRLRNLQDFAKRLFGIQIDLGGLDADEVVKAENI